MKFDALLTIINKRKREKPVGSYVAGLLVQSDRAIQKVGEEAVEVVIAAKNTDKRRQIEELSDLFFHILLLMAKLNISLDDIYTELDKRNKKDA